MVEQNETNESSLREPLLSEEAGEHSREEDTSVVDEPGDLSPSENSVAVSNELNDPWKNRNVRISFLLCISAGIADSVWSSVVLSGFLYALAGAMGRDSSNNTLVGAAEALEGMTQLVTALPLGYLADRWGKAKVVRVGGVLMILAIVITLAALVDVHLEAESSPDAAKRAYYIMLGALGLWGIVNGISYGPSQALFSDSVPKGQRSDLLTWLYTCYLLSSTVGPVVSIAVLLTSLKNSEDWSLKEIYPIFFAGVCLEIPAAILMFFFDDKFTVPEDDDDDDETQEESTPIDPNEDAPESSEPVSAPTSTYILSKAAIPYVLFLSSLIVSLGSGASVKYFPLFFKELGLSNAAVQGIFLAVPITISGLSFLGTSLGKRIGRIETTVLLDIVGTSLLYFMTWLSRNVGGHVERWRIWLIVIVYLLRTGIMNCSYPLLESILMDSVKSNERARWKSLESIASFGWTGSALVGGILSDQHSYQYTFTATATMQLVGALLLLAIQPLVEPESPAEGSEEPSEDGPSEEVAAEVVSI